ncbi:MAG: transaldolase [Chloroflexi bacterium]|nr:transaldolase [Chloroflexota bacterium]MDA1173937.1 transaldolase [Chloroflexota bacterium]
MENIIIQNQTLGQSTWVDYIQRSMLTTGQLGGLVKDGVTGLTSNPTIFEKAITTSADYDVALTEIPDDGRSATDVFETLAVEDIQGAADILRAVYDFTDGRDGYVSLEVPPSLAQSTKQTVAEARRLFGLLRRPNVMIKVPATYPGISAVRALIGEGINVNVTLIFSLAMYQKVINAYLSGLEDLVAAGKDPSRVASVASFFISRIDTAADAQLRAIGGDAANLTGKTAIANAQAAYALFQDESSGARFQALSAKGARPQRPLWASTSTKDPALSDTLYVDQLIGQDTVNTVPPATLEAILDHGTSADTLAGSGPSAKAHLDALASAGVDLDAITAMLLYDGLTAFSKSFDDLLTGIESKRAQLTKP